MRHHSHSAWGGHKSADDLATNVTELLHFFRRDLRSFFALQLYMLLSHHVYKLYFTKFRNLVQRYFKFSTGARSLTKFRIHGSKFKFSTVLHVVRYTGSTLTDRYLAAVAGRGT